MPRMLDDATFTLLNSLIFMNNVELVRMLLDDEKLINKILKAIEDAFMDAYVCVPTFPTLILFLRFSKGPTVSW